MEACWENASNTCIEVTSSFVFDIVTRNGSVISVEEVDIRKRSRASFHVYMFWVGHEEVAHEEVTCPWVRT